MGKQIEKKKKQVGAKSGDSNGKESKVGENSHKTYDEDTTVFISMSRGLKDEGNKLFQKRDYEGAMLKYEKAIKLLPRDHIDVSYLRSNMAACYMQMGLSEYPRAIHECNLALEVTPKYSKALLKRARCYEALNRLDFSLRDVNTVLKVEPNNVMAIEIAERLRTTIEKKGIKSHDNIPINLVPEYVEPPVCSPLSKVSSEKLRKKKGKKLEDKRSRDETEEKKKMTEEKEDEKKAADKVEVRKAEKKTDGKKDKVKFGVARTEEKAEDKLEEKKAEDKLVVEEIISNVIEEEHKRNFKLVFGDDIRWVQLPFNCSILKLREVVYDRFPSSKAVLIKYRDREGDLVSITTNEELRWAEASVEQEGSVRLYIVGVNPEQDPFYAKFKKEKITGNGSIRKSKNKEMGSSCIDDWIIQFAQLFKDYVGFNSDSYLDLHELGMKLYSEAMEETVTSEDAQELFNTAGEKFQEMAALALFNWGNVHMSRARKRVYFTEDDTSRESVLSQVKTAYDWAQKEYLKAGHRYEEALRIKPDFYEGVLALGKQQFEQAKLSWYYAIGTNVDLETWPSAEVLQLYNNAEDNLERGMQMWEEAEEQRHPAELSRQNKVNLLIREMGLDEFNNDISAEEAAEQASNMRSHINLLWGTMLYERSIMEFKLGLPVWQECLEVAIEKFELAGASPTDIAVMIKNHCSSDTALEGFEYRGHCYILIPPSGIRTPREL
ncbi:hypothetical protein U1Q18_044410 [Sarracenia purpurea var. burkii]